jgi:tripartite-type tricarboxylate transporter receptor subunit TctC
MKSIVTGLALALAPLSAHPAYPEKPIRLVVPFPAASGTDIVARELADEMAKDLKQVIVIDNKGGAQGIIGMQSAATSAPDGYTLVILGVTTGASNVSLFKKLPYDPVKDLTPIGMIADSPIVLVGSTQVPASNLQELVRYGRQNPGKLTYGFGSGSAQVAAARVVSMGKFQAVPVAYKGSPQALVDVMNGQVDFMFVDLSVAVSQLAAGKVKAFGVSTKRRFPQAPDIPSIHEAGLPGYDLSVWFALAAPAGLPPEITARISAALNNALRSPTLVEKFRNKGLAVKPSTPAEFGTFLKSEIALWGEMIRDAGIAAQD